MTRLFGLSKHFKDVHKHGFDLLDNTLLFHLKLFLSLPLERLTINLVKQRLLTLQQCQQLLRTRILRRIPHIDLFNSVFGVLKQGALGADERSVSRAPQLFGLVVGFAEWLV
jgi:hypothetical protein